MWPFPGMEEKAPHAMIHAGERKYAVGHLRGQVWGAGRRRRRL